MNLKWHWKLSSRQINTNHAYFESSREYIQEDLKCDSGAMCFNEQLDKYCIIWTTGRCSWIRQRFVKILKEENKYVRSKLWWKLKKTEKRIKCSTIEILNGCVQIKSNCWIWITWSNFKITIIEKFSNKKTKKGQKMPRL